MIKSNYKNFVAYIAIFTIFFQFANFANGEDRTNQLKYVRDIIVKNNETGSLAAITLDQIIYEKINNFSDIRIVDAGKTEIPFRVRKHYLKKKFFKRIKCKSEIVSLKKLSANKIEIVIHNREKERKAKYLTIKSQNKDYDKEITIFQGKTPYNWKEITSGAAIFDYSAIVDLSSNTISLPEGNEGKYYKIIISNFSEQKQSKRMELITEKRNGKAFSEIKKRIHSGEPFKIDDIILESVKIMYHKNRPLFAKTNSKILSTKQIKKETEIILDVFNQPIARIHFKISSTNFIRKFKIYTSNDNKNWKNLTWGEVTNINIGNFKRNYDAKNLPESRNKYIKIVFNNGDAPPLLFSGIDCYAALYNAELLLPKNHEEMKIYYGGELSTPKYDIDAVLAKIANPQYIMLKLSKEEINSNYSTSKSEKSFLENKGFLYIVISIMVIFLAGVLFSSMKKIDNTCT